MQPHRPSLSDMQNRNSTNGHSATNRAVPVPSRPPGVNGVNGSPGNGTPYSPRGVPPPAASEMMSKSPPNTTNAPSQKSTFAASIALIQRTIAC